MADWPRRVGLYFHTLVRLQQVQVLWRVRRRFATAPPLRGPIPSRRHPRKPARWPVARPEAYFPGPSVRVLGVCRTFEGNVDWSANGADLLWLYNLHYFDGLRALRTPAAMKRNMVESWLRHHADPRGVGWEPYPVSLRVVNWIKWITLDAVVDEAIDNSLALQLRSLEATLEYHILGNHLIANAKALAFAGLFFEGPEADHWYRRGLHILHEQLPEQQLSDGGHYERSPMYHAIFCEDLLDLVNLHQVHDRTVPTWLRRAAERAMTWQFVMTAPDGQFPLLNDAAGGVAPTWSELRAYGAVLGVEPSLPDIADLTYLAGTGYIRGKTGRIDLIVDVGPPGPPFLPAHGHCDALSLVLYVDGEPHLIDVGTSTYEAGTRRDYERSTAAHNTVQVGAREQNELWGSFRMARRLRIETVETTASGFVATVRHFGRNGLRHRRSMGWSAEAVQIIDEVETGARAECVARYHLAPGLEAALSGDNAVVGSARLVFNGADRVRLRHYQHAPEFNRLVDAMVVEATFRKRLMTTIETLPSNPGRDA